tara:strand:+ start:16663 stop:16812 length:150 start_codon:yes stop_codon:yes gene_type:complete
MDGTGFEPPISKEGRGFINKPGIPGKEGAFPCMFGESVLGGSAAWFVVG